MDAEMNGKLECDGATVGADGGTPPNPEDGGEGVSVEGEEDGTGGDRLPTASKRSTTVEREATFYEKFADAVLNDKDSQVDLWDEVRSLPFGHDLLNKEKGKVEIRAKQAMLHLTYTESRIRELENEVKKLRQDVYKLPDDFEVPVENTPEDPAYFPPVYRHPVYMHKLKRSTLQEFKLDEYSKDIPESKRPALEVLISEHILPPPLESKFDAQAESPVITNIKEAGGRPSILFDHSSGINPHHSPERLRIRSVALNSLLEQISGDGIGNMYTKGGPNSPVVYLRPFKLFVTYEAEIRASVQEVEARIAEKATQPMGTENEVSRFDDEDLLADLKLLVEFLDVDLKPTFELRKKIKEGTAISIEYQDLWHLFELGDDVIGRSGQSSTLLVYRVVRYTVSNPTIHNQAARRFSPKISKNSANGVGGS